MEPPKRIHQILQAAPIEIAGKVIQPVAQLDGWWSGGRNGAGAWVRLTPATLTVRDGALIYNVPMTDPTENVIRSFARIGATVALVSLLMMLLTTYLARRR